MSRMRVAVLLLMSFCVTAQSAVSALSGIHDVTGHADYHHGPDGHDPDGTDTDPGGTGPLHVLLHHAHCCAHGAWMSGAGVLLVSQNIPVPGLPPDAAGLIPTGHLTAPFRPPIPA